MARRNETHLALMGYVLWFFGFAGLFGLYRFYYGKQITGVIWFFTAGVFLIGWIVDLFLMPGMCRDARSRYRAGRHDYAIAWILLVIPVTAALGIHRFYLGKWGTGLIWLFTGGLLGFGLIYDWLTLNGQIDELHARGL